jgi:hypothetical protein
VWSLLCAVAQAVRSGDQVLVHPEQVPAGGEVGWCEVQSQSFNKHQTGIVASLVASRLG